MRRWRRAARQGAACRWQADRGGRFFARCDARERGAAIMTAVIIRPEQAGDEREIHALHVDAFGGQAEALLVEELRTADDVVLSLVAERNGAILGHILFSRLYVREG